MDLHKLNKLISAYLKHFWCMDESWANIDFQGSPRPELRGRWPGLGEATTFPLIVLSMPSHEAYTQMSFCPRIFKLGFLKFMKFPKLGLL
jgi:hypothetical protein